MFPTSLLFSWEIEETVRKISYVSYLSYESFISWEIEETVSHTITIRFHVATLAPLGERDWGEGLYFINRFRML